MISKERLEQLIEQCATIYMARAYTEGIYLMPENFEVNDKELVFKYKIYAVPLEDLFETEEDAKWFAEFGCIERIERLKLPTWEQMKDKLDKKQVVEKYYYYSKHFYKPNKDEIDIDYTYSMYLMPNGLIIIDDNEKPKTLFSQLLTKENYTLACRKCKELFLGGSNEQI